MKTNPKILVIGIGNEFRCDDGVGIMVAREVAKLNFPDVKVIEQSGEGAALMEVWKETEMAIMIDAVSSDNMPGTVHRLIFSIIQHTLSVLPKRLNLRRR